MKYQDQSKMSLIWSYLSRPENIFPSFEIMTFGNPDFACKQNFGLSLDSKEEAGGETITTTFTKVVCIFRKVGLEISG